MDRSLTTEQINEYIKQMNYYKRFDRDMYLYYRNTLRALGVNV